MALEVPRIRLRLLASWRRARQWHVAADRIDAG
jgi:hypothetical protein